jgi:hypothetical protein
MVFTQLFYIPEINGREYQRYLNKGFSRFLALVCYVKEINQISHLFQLLKMAAKQKKKESHQ